MMTKKKVNKAPSQAEIDANTRGYTSGLTAGYERGYHDGIWATAISTVFCLAVFTGVRIYLEKR